MLILAIESGGSVAVVAAVEFTGHTASLHALATIGEPRALARDLIGTIDRVLDAAGWTLAELDLIVTGLGPGSWTSLRVGLTTAKTLAQAHAIPIIGVPSFDAVAAAAHGLYRDERATKAHPAELPAPPSLLLVLAPCRPGEEYGKLFVSHADYLGICQAEWIAPVATHLDAAYSQMMASEVHGALLIAGESADLAADWLAARGEQFRQFKVSPEILGLDLAIAGAAKLSAGELDDPLTLAPLYLALSNAERNMAAGLLKRH